MCSGGREAQLEAATVIGSFKGSKAKNVCY
jgi:hypothetical protein